LTAQGHPRRIFATAIERGNIVMAEATARELGRISLEEALALTALVAEKDPAGRGGSDAGLHDQSEDTRFGAEPV
jgi:hypothetical protein